MEFKAASLYGEYSAYSDSCVPVNALDHPVPKYLEDVLTWEIPSSVPKKTQYGNIL